MKNNILLFAFILTTCFLRAQQPLENSLLWEVSGNGLKQSSFLYGTFHLLCPEDMNLSAVENGPLSQVKTVYCELDFSNPSLPMEMQQGMMMKENHSLTEYVNEKDFKAMNDSVLAATGIPLEALAKVKPLLLLSFIYPHVLGCNPESPEIKITQIAQQKGIALKGLETVQDQLQVFDKIPYAEQANMLKNYLLTKDAMKDETLEMLKEYEAQNINTLYQLTAEVGSGYEKYNDVLLANRNKNWISIIEKESKSASTLYAVGAAHLGGNNGLIALLRAKGYTVTPVKK